MDESIIHEKIEKTVDLICRLYSHNIITGAIIFGSVAKGTATKDSDIDIYLIHPQFQDADMLIPMSPKHTETLPKIILVRWESIFNLINILQEIGVEFKELSRKGLKTSSYQLYKGELFHLMTRDRINPFMEGIEISKEICM